MATAEEERPGERDGEHGEIGVSLLACEHDERVLHVRDRLLDVTLQLPGEQPELRPDAGGRMGESEALESLDCLLEVHARVGRTTPQSMAIWPARSWSSAARRGLSDELERLLEVALGALARAQGGRALARTRQHGLGRF